VFYFWVRYIHGTYKTEGLDPKEINNMSEYSKLKNKGLGRGRPALKPEEREQRKEFNAKRQEARRRAHIVLQHRYAEEYEKIFSAELKELTK
jgi:hypothetical protein